MQTDFTFSGMDPREKTGFAHSGRVVAGDD